MNQFPALTSLNPNDPFLALRGLLNKALTLMDEISPSSIPAARLQQIIDELDRDFASVG